MKLLLLLLVLLLIGCSQQSNPVNDVSDIAMPTHYNSNEIFIYEGMYWQHISGDTFQYSSDQINWELIWFDVN